MSRRIIIIVSVMIVVFFFNFGIKENKMIVWSGIIIGNNDIVMNNFV